jgi:CHASE3 domain sensor protein
VDSDSIRETEENVAKLQSALDDAQQVLQAAERAQEAAQRAHEAAEQHVATLRMVLVLAIGVIVVALLVGLRRRQASGPPASRR